MATGDIDDMWIRDSAVQLSIYFPRIAERLALRRVIEGAIRAQAFYILQASHPIVFAYHQAMIWFSGGCGTCIVHEHPVQSFSAACGLCLVLNNKILSKHWSIEM